MKQTVVLQLTKETKGALIYAVPDILSQIVGQVYVRKQHFSVPGSEWPKAIAITVEPVEVTE